MDGDRILQDASTEDLLEAGNQAFAAGKRRAAHNIWRSAAVANPYDERVWVLLLQVLHHDDDRKVCLENIIAINPLNTDARRQLRQLRRDERLIDDHPLDEQDQLPARAAKTSEFDFDIEALPHKPRSEPMPPKSGSLVRALFNGVGIGLLAVALGIIISVIVYGGVLPTVAP